MLPDPFPDPDSAVAHRTTVDALNERIGLVSPTENGKALVREADYTSK
jgi:hypothetical protein